MNDNYFSNLMAAEGLKSFSIREHFCEQCGDLTPHHIEDVSAESLSESTNQKKTHIAPISIKECIICRNEEEASIDGYDL